MKRKPDNRPSLLRRILGRLLPPATPRLEERESIWSIYRRDARTFFRLVGLLWTGALAYIVSRKASLPPQEWTDDPLAPDAPWWHYAGDFAMAVMTDFAPVGVGFAILAMLLTRPLNIVGDILMTLYQAMVNRLVIPVIQAHEARGRAAERAEWQAWNHRRLNAQAKGQPFQEPPPGED